jgi:uncharacterized protein (TIGR01777 family)
MNVAVAGGSGFIGRALVDALAARGDSVVLLTRAASRAGTRPGANIRAVVWDGKSTGDWVKAVDGTDAVINLCGEGVAAGRWTAARKIQLVRSRIDSTRALVAAISQASKRPKTLISASGIGYYGSSPEGEVKESSPQGRDFLAALCGQWEREALAAEPLGVRVMLARLGVVLGAGGGALAKMSAPFKLFAGGPLGAGTQGFSWIHRDDAVAALLYALLRDMLSGPVNIVSPEPLSNRDFSAALGRALHRPSWLPTPGFALKLALGEMSEMLLGGQFADPQKLRQAGFAFRYPDAASALSAIYPG